MTDQELKDLVAGLAIAQAKTDAQLAKTDAQLAKTDAQLAKTDSKIERLSDKIERIGEMLGNIGNNQGDVAEQFFYNALDDKHELAGIHYDYATKNLNRHRGSVQDEFDIVLVNGKDVAIIETKYKAHERDLDRLLTSKKENFETLFTEYSTYNHHYALASFYFTDDLKKRALENGIIVIERKGKTIETFVPMNR